MTSASSEVVLVRHAETEWSLSGKHTGHSDIPLTERGRERAVALGDELGQRRFDLVLTSPLARATETCSLAGFEERAVLRDDLMEWDYGAYEGRRTIEIREELPGWSLWRDGTSRRGDGDRSFPRVPTACSTRSAPSPATASSSPTGISCECSPPAGSAWSRRPGDSSRSTLDL